MNSFICQPRNDNNLFLVACILFCVDALYTVWAFISSMQLMFALLFILAVVTAVLFFLAYLGKVSLIAPFTALALRLLVELLVNHAARGGFFGFLSVMVAIYTILCLGGIIRFDFNLDIVDRFRLRCGKPLLIAAALFALFGVISIIRCLTNMNYGVTILYVLDTLCLFGAAVISLLSLEQDSEAYEPRDEFLEYARNVELENLIYDDKFFEELEEEYGRGGKGVPAGTVKPAPIPPQPKEPAPETEMPFGAEPPKPAETPFEEPVEKPAAASAMEPAVKPAEAVDEPAVKPAQPFEAETPTEEMPEEEPGEYLDVNEFIRAQDEHEAQVKQRSEAQHRAEIREQLGADGLEVLAVIRKMAELRDQGILTESEFEKKKKELLKRL